LKEVLNPARWIGAFIVGDYSDEEDGYWVCVEVNKYDEIPVGMISLTIPSQKYAVIRHTGPREDAIEVEVELYDTIK
jgi:predicted transcriptional regulator YdeE